MNSHAHVILELPAPNEVSIGYESSLIFNKFQLFGDSIPNEFRDTFLQRESKHTEALIGRHPIGHL